MGLNELPNGPSGNPGGIPRYLRQFSTRALLVLTLGAALFVRGCEKQILDVSEKVRRAFAGTVDPPDDPLPAPAAPSVGPRTNVFSTVPPYKSQRFDPNLEMNLFNASKTIRKSDGADMTFDPEMITIKRDDAFYEKYEEVSRYTGMYPDLPKEEQEIVDWYLSNGTPEEQKIMGMIKFGKK